MHFADSMEGGELLSREEYALRGIRAGKIPPQMQAENAS